MKESSGRKTTAGHARPAGASQTHGAHEAHPAGRPSAAADSPGPATAHALIRAGRRLFTRHGYDGTSVRAITRAAGANLGAITYHFGSKRALYGAVVAACVGPFRERVLAAAAGPGAPLDRIEAVVRAFFASLDANPEVPQLMMQEVIVGRELPEEAAAVMRPMLAALRGAVEQGQRDGTIRPGDASLMAASVISQPVHMTLARPMLRKIMKLDTREADTRRRMVDHAALFVRRGLASTEEEAR